MDDLRIPYFEKPKSAYCRVYCIDSRADLCATFIYSHDTQVFFGVFSDKCFNACSAICALIILLVFGSCQCCLALLMAEILTYVWQMFWHHATSFALAHLRMLASIHSDVMLRELWAMYNNFNCIVSTGKSSQVLSHAGICSNVWVWSTVGNVRSAGLL